MSLFKPITLPIKQQLFTQLCEQFDDAIFILDANLRYLAVNATYEIMIGYKEAFLIGRPLGIYAAEFLSADERTLLQDISLHLDHHGFYENHFSMMTRYEQVLECHMTYRRLCVGDEIYHVGMVRDISANVKDKQQVSHLLNYDQLTGLPNRKIFLSQTSEALLDSYQEVVIVRFNIDRYRILVSALGQDHVDELVQSFVNQVNALNLDNLRCFSHFGGDDFALLFEFSDANLVRNQLDAMMQLCEQPFLLNDETLNDNMVYLHISVGVSYYPENAEQLNTLISQAEKALHYVKEHGGDDVCWYHERLAESTTDNVQLEAALRTALDEGQFEPYYQPKIVLATGEITGFEALVRWRHPTHGILKPSAFIDNIIKNKLSFELFCQMAKKIAQQLSKWQAMGVTQHVCINADAAEFNHPDFFKFVRQLLDEYNLHAHQLHIEVTESSLMLRHTSVKQQLLKLKELGICLALDDFGTGYASLSYLQEYPFDFIKIDKSFISKIEDSATQRAIVKAILDLATALDMRAVAEGIETVAQRDLLLQMGCTYAQGYWFSHPVAADSATAMLL